MIEKTTLDRFIEQNRRKARRRKARIINNMLKRGAVPPRTCFNCTFNGSHATIVCEILGDKVVFDEDKAHCTEYDWTKKLLELL